MVKGSHGMYIQKMTLMRITLLSVDLLEPYIILDHESQ